MGPPKLNEYPAKIATLCSVMDTLPSAESRRASACSYIVAALFARIGLAGAREECSERLGVRHGPVRAGGWFGQGPPQAGSTREADRQSEQQHLDGDPAELPESAQDFPDRWGHHRPLARHAVSFHERHVPDMIRDFQVAGEHVRWPRPRSPRQPVLCCPRPVRATGSSLWRPPRMARPASSSAAPTTPPRS